MINIEKHLSDDDLMIWKTSMIEQWNKPFYREPITKQSFENAWAYQEISNFSPDKQTYYYVYFISPKNEDSISKIGISKNPFARLKTLQTSHYKDLVLNLFFGAWRREDALRIEKEIHSKLILFENDVWAHILEPNESTMLHIHESGPKNGPPPISWVYYPSSPPRSGNIVFTFECNANRVNVEEEIEESKLIFFSGAIPHYTKKNFSNKNRISISGNFNLPLDTHWDTFDEENWLAYVGVFVN